MTFDIDEDLVRQGMALDVALALPELNRRLVAEELRQLVLVLRLRRRVQGLRVANRYGECLLSHCESPIQLGVSDLSVAGDCPPQCRLWPASKRQRLCRLTDMGPPSCPRRRPRPDRPGRLRWVPGARPVTQPGHPCRCSGQTAPAARGSRRSCSARPTP